MTHELGYSTEIDLGTRPEYFRVLVDISAADSFVISCSPRYNSSPHASSHKTLSILVVTESLASFFEEATKILERSIVGSLSIIEGVLGLSTPSDTVAIPLSRKQLVPIFELLLGGQCFGERRIRQLRDRVKSSA